jgi:hypothetical protein
MSNARFKLATLIDLAAQLKRDEELPNQELRTRDRRIGKTLVHLQAKPRIQLARWLETVRPEAGDSPGQTYSRIQHLGTLLLAAIGLITGWGAAAAVFYYDGTHPVNVVNVIAVFVFLQLAMLILLVITLLPSAVLRLLPGARAVQETLRLLNPGRLRNLASRFVPHARRESLSQLVGTGKTYRVLYGRVERWGMVVASQWFAVMFNLGAIAGALALISFSDLAFSWSTTLQVDADRLHRVTSVLAAPWARALPSADPSPELIRHSRHFRLQESQTEPVDPSVLAGWWEFLILCMAGYGLLPRIVTVLTASWRFGAAMDRAMLQLPGVPELLDRLNRQLVVTASTEPSSAEPGPAADAGPAAPVRVGDAYALVHWAEVASSDQNLEAWAARQWSAPPAKVFSAGGAHSLAQDREVIQQLGALSGSMPVLVAVKAWEPPVAECVDFLVALRQQLGKGREVQVIPLSRRPDGALQPPGDRHFGQWQRRLKGIGDPWLSARRLPAGGAA